MAPTSLQNRTRSIEKVVGLVTIAAALIVWQALRVHERSHVQKIITIATNSIKADLLADLETRSEDQRYLARHAEAGRVGDSKWMAHADQYLSNNPWCLAILWLDDELEVAWAMPASARQELRAAVLQHGQQALAESRTNGQPRTTHSFQLSTGPTLIMDILPAFRAGQHVGSVVFVTEVRKSLDEMLKDVSAMGYAFAIFDQDVPIYRLFPDSSPAEERWAQSAEVEISGVVWRLQVWPRAELLAEVQSALPGVLFAVVSALGMALIVTVHYESVARGKSRSADLMNAHLESEIKERQRVEAALRDSRRRLAGVLETSADAIISTDDALIITFFNRAAEQIFGYSAKEIVGQPLGVLLPPRFREMHRQHMMRFAAGPQGTVRMGERSGIVGMRRDGAEFPADAAISKVEANGKTILTAFLRDITDRVAADQALRKAHEELECRVAERTAELAVANTSLQKLSGHLLKSQEEERRRIARELHDSTASNLVLVSMTLDKLRAADAEDTSFGKDLEECWHWVQQTMTDIRTLAYRLHPPMLEGLGLTSALHWYINGFSQRSGIDILLDFDQSTPRLPMDTELTLFRIVQESLTNIQRHSKSNAAEITLKCEDSLVRLEIVDKGVGIPPELFADGKAMLGVGIAGMRERVRQLEGQLAIQSNASGTTITVTLPRTQSNSFAA